MSSNVALLHSNNCCVLEPAICEDLDLHVVIFRIFAKTKLQTVIKAIKWLYRNEYISIDKIRLMTYDFRRKAKRI